MGAYHSSTQRTADVERLDVERAADRFDEQYVAGRAAADA